LALSVPISFAIAISTLITIMISLPLDSALTVVTQKWHLVWIILRC
ncbi:hypothetical protein AAUPMB_20312, partial [Pasteurella multocida subsp. multocida str. Anand1_buffalo]